MDGTALATQSDNVFTSYGAKVSQRGTFLSFKQGEYLYGTEGKALVEGTKVVVNMPELRIGWRRWSGGQVTDDLTNLLMDQVPVEPRNTLGDDDQSLWEKPPATPQQPDPPPRDPWQLTNVLPMATSDGEEYIFSTSGKGGVGAIGELCKAYGRLYRQHPGQVPVVSLGRDFYMHKSWGKTWFPVFTIVCWTNENALTIEEGESDPPTDAAGVKSLAATQTGAQAASVDTAVKATIAPNGKKPRF